MKRSVYEVDLSLYLVMIISRYHYIVHVIRKGRQGRCSILVKPAPFAHVILVYALREIAIQEVNKSFS